MNTTFDILVIVLSSLLGIFLILAIIVIALTLKLISSLRVVVAKGEHLVDSAEEWGDMLKKNAGAVGAIRTVMKLIQTINKYKK